MWRALHLRSLWGAVAALVLLSACDQYKQDLLPPRDQGHSGQGGEGGDAGGAGASGGDGGVEPDGGAGSGDSGMVCRKLPEICNLADDDCDGDVDEKEATEKACEAIVLHAVTQCVVTSSTHRARCLKIECHPGFADRDGDPTNGCEEPVDEGDGGADSDAGP